MQKPRTTFFSRFCVISLCCSSGSSLMGYVESIQKAFNCNVLLYKNLNHKSNINGSLSLIMKLAGEYMYSSSLVFELISCD